MKGKSISVVLFLVPAVSTAADQADLDANKQIIRRYYEAVSYPAKLDELNELVSEDFVGYGRAG